MRKISRFAIPVVVLALLVVLAAVFLRPRSAPPPETTPGPTRTLSSTRTSRPTPSPRVDQNGTPAAGSVDFACEANPLTAQMVAALEPEAWMQWIRQLSGAEPVIIDGQETTITTRWTPAMFGDGGKPRANARAFEYVLQSVRGWYPEEQIELQPFPVQSQDQQLTAQNLILTLPGVSKPDEVVILSAHLDSISNQNPAKAAPGAEDNGSGSAALLEIARLFRERQFERTIRIIWFTGEEQGLFGSRYYVSQLDDPQSVIGVVNLDMFGFDSDDDRCFEMHIGRLAASDQIGQCFIQSAQAYQQELEVYDYLTEGGISASDHGPFWEAGIGAIEILENMFPNHMPGGCANADNNDGYHSARDTADRINPESGIRIVRSALATVAAMAGVIQ